jgi:hypothetical protein
VILAFILLGAIQVLIYTSAQRIKRDYNELQTILEKDRAAFELEKLVTGETIAIQSQTISSLENAVSAGLIREKELKELNIKQLQSFVKITQKLNIDSITAGWTTPPAIIIRDTVVLMKLPHQFQYLDKWAVIRGIVKREGVLFDSISMVNDMTFITGYQKQGFLKPALPILSVSNNNPYMTITAMQNVVIKEKPPWYNRPNFYRAQGAIATGLLFYLIK